MILFFKKRGNLLLLLFELVLGVFGILSLIDNVFFIVMKKETNAEIIKVESLPLPKPYKVTLKYYNEYLNKTIVSYIDDIDGIYGEKLPKPTGNVSIYYKRYFPKEIYLIDYRYPNSGYVILNIVFLVIIGLAVYFQALQLHQGRNIQ